MRRERTANEAGNDVLHVLDPTALVANRIYHRRRRREYQHRGDVLLKDPSTNYAESALNAYNVPASAGSTGSGHPPDC
jgi:hypothetical protein